MLDRFSKQASEQFMALFRLAFDFAHLFADLSINCAAVACVMKRNIKHLQNGGLRTRDVVEWAANNLL